MPHSLIFYTVAWGLIQHSKRGRHRGRIHDYGGVAMLEDMEGLLLSQPRGLGNQPPIGLFDFSSNTYSVIR